MAIAFVSRPGRIRGPRARVLPARGMPGGCVASGQRPHRTLGCLDRRGPRERANIRGGEGRAGGPPRSFEGRAPKKKSEARASDPACQVCGDGSGAGGAWGCRLASVSGVPRGAFAMASRSPDAVDANPDLNTTNLRPTTPRAAAAGKKQGQMTPASPAPSSQRPRSGRSRGRAGRRR